MKSLFAAISVCFLCISHSRVEAVETGTNQTPATWRAEKRVIDLHQHIDSTPEHLAQAVRIMDAVGIGLGVNLSGGVTTSVDGKNSEFQRNKALADKLFPGRFLLYMNLDYAGWDEPDWSDRAVRQVEEGHRLGAAGLKEYKRLGLYLRDKNKRLIKVDDPKLDPVWKRCGELGMPVSIHVADPKAFWEPYNDTNERWTELKDHKNWWFGNPEVYPKRMEIVEALNRVIGRHPKTTFVAVHFANNAEDLAWVDRSLSKYPNMMADLAARIPEIGRQDPGRVRELFLKHQDRIFFATDFQAYERLTLGSGGSGAPPTEEDAREFYGKHWRWLETNDRDFPHMTPIQGDWTISGIGLPNSVLRKIYFDNARKLLARSLPAPVCKVSRLPAEIDLDDLENRAWSSAPVARMEYESLAGVARPEIGTSIRLLYSPKNLYIRYDAPFQAITTFDPVSEKERIGLWDKDVVEAFIGTDPENPKTYYEFEVAPSNEKLDLIISPETPDVLKRFEWNSDFQSFTRINSAKGEWHCVMRIPLSTLAKEAPTPGTQWRINFYRIDKATDGYLAWNPTLTGTYHAPDRFGWLQFQE